MGNLPSDLQQLLDEVDAADRAADEVSAALTDEQFHWQPDEGRRWSVAQCLDHLAVINRIYVAAIRAAIDGARSRGWTRTGAAHPGFFGRRFVRSMEPPVKRRSKTFRIVEPRGNRTREEILRDYHAAHDEVRRLIEDAAANDANRATFRNPFIKIRVRVATGLHVIPAHDRRHLWQARQVMQDIRFPAFRVSERS